MVGVCRKILGGGFLPSSHRLGVSGFTVIEVLVAVAVLSVGVTVLISLFSSSLVLARTSRNETIAAAFAEEQLLLLEHNPAQYDWPLDSAAPGELVKVVPKKDLPESSLPKAEPATLPALYRAVAREQDFCSKFTCEVYGKQPRVNAPYVEVTAVVRWKDAGRDRLLSLTSALPRSVLPGAGAGSGRP